MHAVQEPVLYHDANSMNIFPTLLPFMIFVIRLMSIIIMHLLLQCG